MLINGETGTGKTWLARLIHDLSGRRNQAFVHVNCASIPRELFEREMFGHRKGAFTGAEAPGPGLFEAASGGTLLLDEIGELAPTVQGKLLRTVETGLIRRLGDTRELHTDVRLISATNVCVQDAIARGSFREDLYYRCAVLELTLPPLRARTPEEFGHLVGHIFDRISPGGVLDSSALPVLGRHSWPGNIRELENVLYRSVAAANGGVVEERHVKSSLSAARGIRPGRISGKKRYSAPPPLEERRLIAEILRDELGNRRRAAERLGMSRSSLWSKLRFYGLSTMPYALSSDPANRLAR